MLSGLHFLLTYACNFECDHCFVYSRPGAKGTFTIAQIRDVLAELVRLGTVNTVYFEGGEPALYYATMLEGIRGARDMGFKTGVVTNSYWATSTRTPNSGSSLLPSSASPKSASPTTSFTTEMALTLRLSAPCAPHSVSASSRAFSPQRSPS